MLKPVPLDVAILVVDDHPMVREALSGLLGSICAERQILECGDLESAFDELQRSGNVGLVMLDLTLPGQAGLSALWTVRERAPDVPVCVFSANADADLIRQAISAGARGFLPKHADRQVMRHAIELVLHGSIFIPPDALSGQAGTAAAAPVDPSRSPPGAASISNATPIAPMPRRRREILELLAQGRSNKEICRELGISLNTVKTHVAMIFETLGVHKRYELFAAMSGQATARTSVPAPNARSVQTPATTQLSRRVF